MKTVVLLALLSLTAAAAEPIIIRITIDGQTATVRIGNDEVTSNVMARAAYTFPAPTNAPPPSNHLAAVTAAEIKREMIARAEEHAEAIALDAEQRAAETRRQEREARRAARAQQVAP